jgi:hypothetical protein
VNPNGGEVEGDRAWRHPEEREARRRIFGDTGRILRVAPKIPLPLRGIGMTIRWPRFTCVETTRLRLRDPRASPPRGSPAR